MRSCRFLLTIFISRLGMRYFLLFILVSVTFLTHAHDHFVININSGNYGSWGNLPLKNNHSSKYYFSIINVGIEDRNTNIGIGFSPMMSFKGLTYVDNFYFRANSFINLNLYRNIINFYFFENKNFYLGPFTSINYMFVDDEILWRKCILTSGIQMGLRSNFDKFNYHFFSIETGYRNINGNSRFYIGGNIDLATLVHAISLLLMKNDD